MQFSSRHSQQAGFSLIELSIVLLIVGLLLASLIPSISSQIEQKNTNETRKQLDEIQQALIGFAIANGRLPCPASSSSNGAESFAVGGTAANGICSNFNNGFVPAATLGLVSTGGTGYAEDAWGNRIRYAVTSYSPTSAPAVPNVFTAANGMSARGIGNLAPNTYSFLLVCSSASANNDNCSVANTSLASIPGVPAVIYSTGRNGGFGGASADEAENPNPNSTNNNRIFVSHPPIAGNNEFDDIVIWLSPNILINRMVSAGKLP